MAASRPAHPRALRRAAQATAGELRIPRKGNVRGLFPTYLGFKIERNMIDILMYRNRKPFYCAFSVMTGRACCAPVELVRHELSSLFLRLILLAWANKLRHVEKKSRKEPSGKSVHFIPAIMYKAKGTNVPPGYYAWSEADHACGGISLARRAKIGL